MNPQELSAYLTGLLRGEAEAITSFIMGVLLTGMLVFALRRWVFPRGEPAGELARKDAELARKDTEIARKDVQIAKIEAKLVSLEETVSKQNKPSNALLPDIATFLVPLMSSSSNGADNAGAQSQAAQLEAENQQLKQANQALELTVEQLRKELAQVSGELAHSAKWLNRLNEENARLTESGSLADR